MNILSDLESVKDGEKFMITSIDETTGRIMGKINGSNDVVESTIDEMQDGLALLYCKETNASIRDAIKLLLLELESIIQGLLRLEEHYGLLKDTHKEVLEYQILLDNSDGVQLNQIGIGQLSGVDASVVRKMLPRKKPENGNWNKYHAEKISTALAAILVNGVEEELESKFQASTLDDLANDG